jgi:hypothetical protein
LERESTIPRTGTIGVNLRNSFRVSFMTKHHGATSLVTSRHFSPPSIEVELGGQALEWWPRELFVSAELATQALDHFLNFGKQEGPLTNLVDDKPNKSLTDVIAEELDKKGEEPARSGTSDYAHATAEHRTERCARSNSGGSTLGLKGNAWPVSSRYWMRLTLLP